MDAANTLIVTLAAVKTYPILFPLALVMTPWKVFRSLPRMISELRVRVAERIEMRDNLKHSDYFEQLLPAGQAGPKTAKEIGHVLTIAGQLIVGGYDPTSVAMYMMLHFLLQHPDAVKDLTKELRENFSSYDEIDAEKLRTMPWLNACLQETMRLGSPATHHSLPRTSPGALVNGEYIAKGVSSRNLFSYARTGVRHPVF